MNQTITYLKLRDQFKKVPFRSGSYAFLLRYNPFFEKVDRTGLKLSNLNFKPFMKDRSPLLVLKAIRRLTRAGYRRFSYSTEMQFNLLRNTGLLGQGEEPADKLLRHRRSSRFQAYSGRLTKLSKLCSNTMSFSLNSLNYRSKYFFHAPNSVSRLVLLGKRARKPIRRRIA